MSCSLCLVLIIRNDEKIAIACYTQKYTNLSIGCGNSDNVWHFLLQSVSILSIPCYIMASHAGAVPYALI